MYLKIPPIPLHTKLKHKSKHFVILTQKGFSFLHILSELVQTIM